MLTTEQKELVHKFLDKQYGLKKQENGQYEGEIYRDRDDDLESDTIKDILSQDKAEWMMDKFYDLLGDMYFEAEGYEHDCLMDSLADDRDLAELYEEFEDEVREYIIDMVYFSIPYDDFLNQELEIDIIVDTGDENYDYTLNCVYPHYNGIYRDTISNEAAIVWLSKQQGYKKSQLNSALNDEEYGDSRFFKSLRQEILDCTTHMNALTFFVKMTLGEVIDIRRRMEEGSKNDVYKNYRSVDKRKGKDFIILNREVNCGLYDYWQGAGSILDIQLETDVKLPLKYISSISIDGDRGYGVDEVYCMCSTFWKRGMII